MAQGDSGSEDRARLYHYGFGDETGEAGFRFDRGSSSFFVAGLVLTNRPDDLRNYVSDFQHRLGLNPMDEISFHRSPDRNRVAFLQGLLDYDLVIRALVVNKASLSAELGILKRTEFYVWAFGELLARISNELNSATITLDEFGSSDATVDALRRALRQRLSGPAFRQHIRRIRARRSQSEAVLQIADMVTGAVYRHITTGVDRFYRVVQARTRILRVQLNENLSNYPTA